MGILLWTNLAVLVQQSVSVCVCVCVTCELNDRRPRYLACWFNLTAFRSRTKVKVIDQSSRYVGNRRKQAQQLLG